MARYTVTWHPTMEQRLADLWMATSDRGAMTAATDEIDSTLAADPFRVGESRSENQRVWFVPPLVIIYEVSEDDRLVTVQDVNTC
jgi:hypothetical protein